MYITKAVSNELHFFDIVWTVHHDIVAW